MGVPAPRWMAPSLRTRRSLCGARAAVASTSSSSLLDRLETLTGLPRRVLGGAAAGVFAVVGLFVVAVGRPDMAVSHVFDDDAHRALDAAWRRDGPAGWGGPLDDAEVVASVKPVCTALAPGVGGPVDVVVVAEGEEAVTPVHCPSSVAPPGRRSASRSDVVEGENHTDNASR